MLSSRIGVDGLGLNKTKLGWVLHWRLENETAKSDDSQLTSADSESFNYDDTFDLNFIKNLCLKMIGKP